MRLFSFCSLVALLLGSAASAQTAAPAQTPAGAKAPTAAAQAASGDTVICRSMASTGTRFMTKVCHTKADWEQMEADSKQLTQDSQRNYGPH